MSEGISQEELDGLLRQLDTEVGGADESKVRGTRLPTGDMCITINGRILGVWESTKLVEKINELIAGMDQHVLLDVSDCPFLSSFALGQIARLALERIKRNKKVVIVGAAKIVRDMLELASLDQAVTFCDTLDEAAAFVSQ